MPTCKRCGKSVSVLTMNLGTGMCGACAKAEREAILQAPQGKTFECKLHGVGDVTKFEELHTSVAGFGLRRSSMRKATVKLQNGKLELVCHPKEGMGDYTSLGEVDLSDFQRVTVRDLTFGEQVRGALVMGALGGLGVGVLMFFMVGAKIGFDELLEDMPENLPMLVLLLLGMLLFGQLLGFLFSTVPIMVKSRSAKLFDLHRKDGGSVSLAVEPTRTEEVGKILAEFDLAPQHQGTSTAGAS